MTRARRLRWMLPTAIVGVAAAGLGTTAVFADSAAPAAERASTAMSNASAPYGYGSSALTDCFDDRGVPYRQEDTAEGRAMTPLGRNNPKINAVIETCNKLTTPPANANVTAYGNAVSRVIISCLRDRGYDLETSADEMADGDGRSVITWKTIPNNELATTSQAYRDDREQCTAYAQSTVPSPAPASRPGG